MSSASGTRRTTILNRRAGQRARLHFWLKRLAVLGGVFVVLLVTGYYLTMSGYLGQIEGRTTRAFHDSMASNGFSVDNLLIEGRINTDRAGLKTLLDVSRGQSIFEPDLVDMKRKIEQLTWVKHVVIERHLPNTLTVRLIERRPLALWQRQNKLVVIDSEGTILTEINVEKFKNMLILVGDKAPQYAPELVAMIEVEPNLSSRVESAKWIGGRRWNLYLRNGVEVKLPEEDIGQAVRRLAEAQGEGHLMDKKVQSIDLRDPVRIIVQTEPGASSDHSAGSKIEKNI